MKVTCPFIGHFNFDCGYMRDTNCFDIASSTINSDAWCCKQIRKAIASEDSIKLNEDMRDLFSRLLEL